MPVCRCHDCKTPLRQGDYFACLEVVTRRFKEYCAACYEDHKDNPDLELQYPRSLEKINWIKGGF